MYYYQVLRNSKKMFRKLEIQSICISGPMIVYCSASLWTDNSICRDRSAPEHLSPVSNFSVHLSFEVSGSTNSWMWTGLPSPWKDLAIPSWPFKKKCSVRSVTARLIAFRNLWQISSQTDMRFILKFNFQKNVRVRVRLNCFSHLSVTILKTKRKRMTTENSRNKQEMPTSLWSVGVLGVPKNALYLDCSS